MNVIPSMVRRMSPSTEDRESRVSLSPSLLVLISNPLGAQKHLIVLSLSLGRVLEVLPSGWFLFGDHSKLWANAEVVAGGFPNPPTVLGVIGVELTAPLLL